MALTSSLRCLSCTKKGEEGKKGKGKKGKTKIRVRPFVPKKAFSIFKFRRVAIRGAQPSARLSEEIFLLEGSQGPLRGSLALRLLNALNSEDRGLKVRFSLATIAFDRESAQMSQILSSQGKNAPSNPYPHYLVRLATSR